MLQAETSIIDVIVLSLGGRRLRHLALLLQHIAAELDNLQLGAWRATLWQYPFMLYIYIYIYIYIHTYIYTYIYIYMYVYIYI